MTSPDPSGTADIPLSSIPPPRLGKPTSPPLSPSDQLKPQTLIGVASRTTSGCLVLTTDIGAYEIDGDVAAEALAHPRVKVTGMPRPDVRGSCDLVVVTVTAVFPA